MSVIVYIIGYSQLNRSKFEVTVANNKVSFCHQVMQWLEVTALNNVLQMSYPPYCSMTGKVTLFFLQILQDVRIVSNRCEGAWEKCRLWNFKKVPSGCQRGAYIKTFRTVVMFDAGADKRKAGYLQHIRSKYHRERSSGFGLIHCKTLWPFDDTVIIEV